MDKLIFETRFFYLSEMGIKLYQYSFYIASESISGASQIFSNIYFCLKGTTAVAMQRRARSNKSFDDSSLVWAIKSVNDSFVFAIDDKGH